MINIQRVLTGTLIGFSVLLLILLSCVGCGDSYVHSELVPVPGPRGPRGLTGDKGDTGASGMGCSVSEVLPSLVAPNGGAIITCWGSSALIINGAPGQDGQDGQDGQNAVPGTYPITELIDPCGDAPSVFDEVLLRLNNNTIVASFSENSNGKNTRLSLLIPGTYQTTDGSSCTFTVHGDYSVTW